jgi:predicted ATPase
MSEGRRRQTHQPPGLEPFVSWVELAQERVPSFGEYPFSLPCVAALTQRLRLDPFVTFFVGENGSGKSTLVEGIAVALGFNAEGGTKNFNFATRSSESPLHRALRVARTHRRPRTGFFLRAESLFNVATNIEHMDAEPLPVPAPPVIDSYGGRSLHEQSHGESFMATIKNRFGASGLYLMDEPESALSPTRQLELLREVRKLCRQGSQFIMATHSPLLMAYPGALIYGLSGRGIERIAYEDTEHYRVTCSFLKSPTKALEELFAGIDGKSSSSR